MLGAFKVEVVGPLKNLRGGRLGVRTFLGLRPGHPGIDYILPFRDILQRFTDTVR